MSTAVDLSVPSDLSAMQVLALDWVDGVAPHVRIAVQKHLPVLEGQGFIVRREDGSYAMTRSGHGVQARRALRGRTADVMALTLAKWAGGTVATITTSGQRERSVMVLDAENKTLVEAKGPTIEAALELAAPDVRMRCAERGGNLW